MMATTQFDEGDRPMNVRTILVPLDGSIIAEAALTPAVELAREARAKLVLLRAAQAHTLPMTGTGPRSRRSWRPRGTVTRTSS
jgi:nucleotide-binding universal stress UspA family protein